MVHLQGGTLENGTDHARATLLKNSLHMDAREVYGSVCLFNLREDLNETTNQATNPEHKHRVDSLLMKLKKRADTGGTLNLAFTDVGPHNKTTDLKICQQQQDTGYLEPIDWVHSMRPSPMN